MTAQVAVYAATDGGQSETFTYGHTWTLDGKGFCVDPELSGWAIGSVIVHTPDSTPRGQSISKKRLRTNPPPFGLQQSAHRPLSPSHRADILQNVGTSRI